MNKQGFINKLLYRNEYSFAQLGPNTLLFHDAQDTITVFIDNGGVNVTHDGWDVESSSTFYEFDINNPYYEWIWNDIYNDILNLYL